DRIIKMHLAPINISVHTTNKELRCKMLHNRFAGEKLSFLDDFYQAQIEMNGQIVLCKGINDKEELRRSIDDLSGYLPFMRSVSVVPAGITKYREGLDSLTLFNKEEAREVIALIEERQEEFYERYGLHFIHGSDELYITAELDFPEEERYDGYIQLENGVGMMRSLQNEFAEGLKVAIEGCGRDQEKEEITRNITIATGKLAYSTIEGFAKEIMEAFPRIKIRVCCIRNEFFGETITVSGLITGGDLIGQLKVEKEKAENEGEDFGEILQIPSNMLRMGEQVFLDDVTVAEVEKALGMRVVPVESGGQDFVDAVLNEKYRMERNNEEVGYIRAY
ncbi:DUF512 domain-containing protein, partial [Lachnospiraceae bacterium OttesenSCG-928-D06]|nr:DUF512 domain-containing protein [Lachnospiraceae bacterium OttesenSCG-928-D06]